MVSSFVSCLVIGYSLDYTRVCLANDLLAIQKRGAARAYIQQPRRLTLASMTRSSPRLVTNANPAVRFAIGYAVMVVAGLASYIQDRPDLLPHDVDAGR
jgi:hypothetical protein